MQGGDLKEMKLIEASTERVESSPSAVACDDCRSESLRYGLTATLTEKDTSFLSEVDTANEVLELPGEY